MNDYRPFSFSISRQAETLVNNSNYHCTHSSVQSNNGISKVASQLVWVVERLYSFKMMIDRLNTFRVITSARTLLNSRAFLFRRSRPSCLHNISRYSIPIFKISKLLETKRMSKTGYIKRNVSEVFINTRVYPAIEICAKIFVYTSYFLMAV